MLTENFTHSTFKTINMIELGNVDLMINNRVNAQGMRYVHISSDEGKTWKSHPDSTLWIRWRRNI